MGKQLLKETSQKSASSGRLVNRTEKNNGSKNTTSQQREDAFLGKAGTGNALGAPTPALPPLNLMSPEKRQSVLDVSSEGAEYPRGNVIHISCK